MAPPCGRIQVLVLILWLQSTCQRCCIIINDISVMLYRCCTSQRGHWPCLPGFPVERCPSKLRLSGFALKRRLYDQKRSVLIGGSYNATRKSWDWTNMAHIKCKCINCMNVICRTVARPDTHVVLYSQLWVRFPGKSRTVAPGHFFCSSIRNFAVKSFKMCFLKLRKSIGFKKLLIQFGKVLNWKQKGTAIVY